MGLVEPPVKSMELVVVLEEPLVASSLVLVGPLAAWVEPLVLVEPLVAGPLGALVEPLVEPLVPLASLLALVALIEPLAAWVEPLVLVEPLVALLEPWVAYVEPLVALVAEQLVVEFTCDGELVL